MSSNWLEEWLQELNLFDYYNLLVQRDLTTPDTLGKLDKSQLKEYGVTKPGHLNRLHKAILKLNYDSTNDSQPLSSSPPLVVEGGAPPVPLRKGTMRRSPSPNTLSVTEEVLRGTLEQPQHVPHRVHSLRKKPSDTIKMEDLLVNKTVATNNVTPPPPTEPDQSNSPAKSSKHYENVGIKSVAKTSPPKPPPRSTPLLSLDRETTPPPIIPPQRSGPINPPLTAPTVTSYDTILKGEVWSQSTNTPVPTTATYATITEPNANNLTTYETIGETLPPSICGDNLYEIIPAIKSNNTTTTTTTPTSNIYDRLTAKIEVDVHTNIPTLPPPLFTPSLPPPEESIHSPVSSISPPPPRVSTPPPVTSLPPFSPPLPPRELSPPPVTSSPPPLPPRELSPSPVTSSPPPLPPRELSPPPVTSLPPSTPPLPPREPSPPPVTSSPPPLPLRELSPPPVTSLPPFSPPLPPANDISHISSVPNFSPPPPPMETLPPVGRPHIPTNLVDDISSPERDNPPRKFNPPVPNRISSLIPEGETVVDSSTSPPVPPITISPVPPITQQGDDDESNLNPIPPPIPKRGTLPPPPPPPITYDDHPECMMQDPETYSISTHQKETRSSTSDESGSGTPGSPLSPTSSTVQIQQLSSGSDNFIGLTPPVNRIHMTDQYSEYALISDSDSDISPYGTPSSVFSALKDVQLRLEPLREDTLLPTNNDYETIPSKPPKPKPRPKSTFIEEKKNNLFGSFENSAGPKDNLTMSYNASYKPSTSPVGNKRNTSPVKRHIPSTQSVKDLAKDLERQTLRHAAVPRSKTETDVTDGRQSTISPNKFRNSFLLLEDVSFIQTLYIELTIVTTPHL